MSGIEAIGLGFAAAQVADVGLRAAFGLWRLASDLKNVPDKIDKAKRELDLLLALVNMIRADLGLATANSAPRENSLLTSAQDASIQALFNELKDQITALEVTLMKIDPNSKKGLKRAWRKVVSVEAEREIMSRCSRLEGLKGSLNVWYNHVSLLMIGVQISKTEGMAKIVETMEYKVRPLDESMASLAGELKQMRTTIQSPILKTESRVNELGASMSSLSNGVSALQCQIGSHHNSDKIHDGNASSIIQKTRSTSSGNKPCIGTSSASKDEEGRCSDSFHRRNFGDPKSPQISLHSSDMDYLAEQISLKLASTPRFILSLENDPEVTDKLLHPLGTTGKPSYSRSPMVCGCRMTSSKKNQSWTMLRLSAGYSEQHQYHCPYYQGGKRVWTVGMQMLLPQLVRRAANISLAIVLSAGSFRFRPNFEITRVVDRKKSPAFRLIEKAIEDVARLDSINAQRFHGLNLVGSLTSCARLSTYEYSDRDAQRAQIILEQMVSQLHLQFALGRASPRDQDENGLTLLHAFTLLAVLLGYFQSQLRTSIAGVIKLLVENGADRNAVVPIRVATDYLPITIPLYILQLCDAYAPVDAFLLSIQARNLPSPPAHDYTGVILDRLLADSGFEISLRDSRFPPLRSWMIQRHPDIAYESGYDKLSLAVIHRLESEVHSLIRRGFDPNGNPNDHQLFTPLFLALGWPAGMLTLLNAGADPCSTIREAMLDPDDECLSLLLIYSCTISHTSPHLLRRCFQPLWHSSKAMLQRALEASNSSHRRDLLIRRFIHDRRQLTDLALAKLTHTERKKACIESLSDGQLLDKSSSSAYLALCRKGVNVPAGLGPSDSPEESVYHDPEMCVEVAEQLYSAGFYSIDDENWSGSTPMQTISRRDIHHRQLEMILWLLEKGAVLQVGDARKFLFKAAAWTLLFPYTPGKRVSMLQLIRKVSSHYHSLYGPVIRDRCLCYCTSYGCAASVYACKSVIRYGSKKLPKLSAHEGKLDMTPMQVESWGEEVCRLIIFKRLGMAHTCCAYGPIYLPIRYHISSEEAQELREEDANYNEALDLYMCLYKNLRKEHSGPFLEFWANWWTVVDKRLPLEPFENRFWVAQDESPTSTDEPLDEPVIDDDGYFPNVDEITSFMRSKSRHWGQEDYADIFSDAIDLFS